MISVGILSELGKKYISYYGSSNLATLKYNEYLNFLQSSNGEPKYTDTYQKHLSTISKRLVKVTTVLSINKAWQKSVPAITLHAQALTMHRDAVIVHD